MMLCARFLASLREWRVLLPAIELQFVHLLFLTLSFVLVVYTQVHLLHHLSLRDDLVVLGPRSFVAI
jgi:hypothetical protein